MVDLPLELFYQIALHLPSTSDVLTFALAHSRVRKVLSTPALFKERLALQGWDVSAWLEEDSNVTVPQSLQGYMERWMHIDHVYCRTVQLFDEAAADSYFSENPQDVGSDRDAREPEPDQLDPEPFDEITSLHPFRLPALHDPSLLGRKTVVWLRKLSEVLPVFLTHHRGGNISRITEARHRVALLTYARVFLSSKSAVVVRRRSISGSEVLEPVLAKFVYPWFERACFCLAALLIQCDTDSVTAIFTDNVVYPNTSFSPFTSLGPPDNVHGYPKDFDPSTRPFAVVKAGQLRISDRFFSTFLIQTMISMTLHLDTSLPLRPPFLPFINPAASFSYDELFELQKGTSPSLWPLPPPWPWLRNRLAGTPLAELLSSNDGCLWAGYYTVQGEETGQDPPMVLVLYSVQGPNAPPPNLGRDPVEYMHFYGEGTDGLGLFILRGTCNTSTGVVKATKAYMVHEWEWQGMITPFGMAGVWGVESNTGWWWIWPLEWSNIPSSTGPD